MANLEYDVRLEETIDQRVGRVDDQRAGGWEIAAYDAGFEHRAGSVAVSAKKVVFAFR